MFSRSLSLFPSLCFCYPILPSRNDNIESNEIPVIGRCDVEESRRRLKLLSSRFRGWD